MRSSALALTLTVTAILLSAGVWKLQENNISRDNVPTHIHTLYSKWRVKYGVLRATPAENFFRLKVFYKKYKDVQLFREQYPETQFALNKISDMTREEIVANMYGAKPMTPEEAENVEFLEPETSGLQAPVAGQARVRGIRDQGQCGSCWAHGCSVAMESTLGGTLDISPQHPVNCKVQAGDSCNGMNAPINCYPVWKNRGYFTYSQLPYLARASSCTNSPSTKNIVQYLGTGDRNSASADFIMNAVSSGLAVGVIINSDAAFDNYRGGVFSGAGCRSGQSTHQVAVVKYDAYTWTIQNSWNTWWGERGYMRIKNSFNSEHRCVCGGSGMWCELFYYKAA